jgi:hypothetical protein
MDMEQALNDLRQRIPENLDGRTFTTEEIIEMSKNRVANEPRRAPRRHSDERGPS